MENYTSSTTKTYKFQVEVELTQEEINLLSKTKNLALIRAFIKDKVRIPYTVMGQILKLGE